MKYLDRNGKAHKKWYKAVISDIKTAFEPAGKRELLDTSPDGDRYQVPESYYYEGHPVPPTSPVIPTAPEIRPTVQAESIEDTPQIDKLVIDYRTAKINLVNPYGKIIKSSSINERLLYGIAAQVIQDNVDEIGGSATDEELNKLSIQVNAYNDEAINRVVAAAFGKNCVLSPAFSDEFMECAAKNINTAIEDYPLQAKTEGFRFFKRILENMEKTINDRLAPKESDETEANG